MIVILCWDIDLIWTSTIGETDSNHGFYVYQSIDYSRLYGLKMAKKLAETFLHIKTVIQYWNL